MPIDLVLVDNNSQDETVPVVGKIWPTAQLIRMEANMGFGKGNNIGFRYALKQGADYLFLLNQDARVEPTTIDSLVDLHGKHTEYGILSPLHCNGNGTRLDRRFAGYVGPARCPNLCSDALLGLPLQDVYETGFVNAAAWLLPRETIEWVGGFDPMFFQYGEDENYVQRVRFQKLKVGVCPRSRIFHDREDRWMTDVRVRAAEYSSALVKYSDVNQNSPDVLRRRMKTLRRRLWKRCFLIGKHSAELRHELQLLREIEGPATTSWRHNRRPGLNYIDLRGADIETDQDCMPAI